MNSHSVQALAGKAAASTGKLLHRPKDLQVLLGIGHTTLYRLIGEGKLTVVKIGTATRITDDSVRALVASLVQEAA